MAEIGSIRFEKGIVSGIDYGSIILKLLENLQQPVINLQEEIAILNQKQLALSEIESSFLSLQFSASSISKASFFNKTKVSSSNESLLTASGTNVSSLGAFTFTVPKLAKTHQVISSSFNSLESTFGSGSIFVEMGNNAIQRSASIFNINGGVGFERGYIKITNRSGNSEIIDLTKQTTVKEIIDEINRNSINVSAQIFTDKIVLTDNSTGTGNFKIENVGVTNTATSLGIAKTVSSNTIFGDDINFITSSTSLNFLNDGLGVRLKYNSNAEEIRITAKDGTIIDVKIPQTATKIGDIIDAINNDTQNGGKVTASINPQRTGLQLKDNTAGAGVLQISAINNANTVMDLGFSDVVPINSANGQQDDSSGDLIIGKRIIPSLSSVLVRNLNGGSRLFEFDGATANDFTGVRNGNITVTNKSGLSTNISLVGIPNVSTITVDPNIGDTTLTLNNTENVSIGSRIRIQEGATSEIKTVIGISGAVVSLDSNLVNDFTTAAKVFNENTVTAVGGGGTTIDVNSTAELAKGLKIIITNGTTTQARYITNIVGNTLTLDSPTTLPVGSIVYVEKESLSDYILTINDKLETAGANVIATINNQLTGINLIDTSAGTGNLTVTNLGTASTANDLGINQSVSDNTLKGNSLSLQYINENTLLSSLNGGRGVTLGSFRITDSVGKIIDVDLSDSTVENIFTVLDRINSASSLAGSSLKARINSTGNGILLIDLAGGTQKIKVTELLNGSTAKDLGILGEADDASPNILDGSFKKEITISSTDTAEVILDKLVALNIPVSMSIVNDGTSINPYRFSFLAKEPGLQNRFTVEKGGNISLDFQLQQSGDNGTLLFGIPDFPNVPFLAQTPNNVVNDVVPGLSINMKGQTSSPVTISVTRDLDTLIDQVQKVVDGFNALVDKITKHTISNPTTGEKGVLAGEFQLKNLKNSIAKIFQDPILGISISDINVGKEIGVEFLRTGKILLNTTTLRDAFDKKFDQVVNFFTIGRKLETNTLLSDLNNGNGVRQIFGNDFKITRKDGVILNIDINNSKTLGQILDLINFHPLNSDGNLKASISSDGKSIVINDTTSGTGSLKVENAPNSFTATDLGIDKTTTETSITGETINIRGSNGLAVKIVEIIDSLVTGPNGFLTLKKDSINDSITKNNEEIEELQKRIEVQEASLVKQFAQLETLLAQSKVLQESLEITLQNFIQGITTFNRRR